MDNVTRRLLTLVSAESDQTHALGLPAKAGLPGRLLISRAEFTSPTVSSEQASDVAAKILSSRPDTKTR